MFFGGFNDAGLELAGAFLEVGVDRRVLEHAQRRFARCNGDRITRQGSGLVHRPEGRDELHQLLARAVCADGHAAADDLAEGSDVGLDVEDRLRAAVGHAESGHDFVEHEQGAGLARELP